ncbi:MAG: hypothetical protein ACLQU3_26895 [Limisphaerales bacterium]
MKNNLERHGMNVMDENAILPLPPSTQATIATAQAEITVDLQKRLDFLDLNAVEMEPVHQDDDVAPFIKDAEDIRKAKAEKRLYAKLRKMEVEQKGILLAEAQKSLAEARCKFESQPQLPYDYTPMPPTTIEDIFRAEKARNELIAIKQQQKAELYKQVMEKRAQELGEQWPGIQEMSQDVRFDHIPKPWPGYKEIIAKAFPGAPTASPKEPNE